MAQLGLAPPTPRQGPGSAPDAPAPAAGAPSRAGSPAAGRRAGGLASWRRWQRIEPYLYVLPALLSIAIWVYRPLFGTLELSVYQWNLLPTSPRAFVGLENYRRVLTLPEMGQAL